MMGVTHWQYALVRVVYTHMAAAAESHSTLQAAVLSCFTAILSGDKSQLRAAEEELRTLEVAESE